MNEQNVQGQEIIATQMPDMAPSANLPALVGQIPDADLIPGDRFSPAEIAKMQEFAEKVDVTDTNVTLTFASGPQQRMSAYLDTLLEDVKAKDAGVAGDLVVEMSTGIKAMKIKQVKEELAKGPVSALGFFAKMFSAARHFFEKQKAFTDHIEKIVQKAEDRKARIIEDNVKLDALVAKTTDHIRDLEFYIGIGGFALKRARQEFRARRDTFKAAINPDPVEGAKLQDMANQINAFETRLVHVKLAYVEAQVAIPQIRIVQEAGKIELSNIVNSILFDLTRLKSAILRVAALCNTSEAHAETEERRRLSIEIAEIGADALDKAYTQAKESQGNVLDDVASLEGIADKLVQTLQKGAEIDRQNIARRREASKKLVGVRDNLIASLKGMDSLALEANSTLGEEPKEDIGFDPTGSR